MKVVNLEKQSATIIIAADEGSEIIYGHNVKSKEELRQQLKIKTDALLTKVSLRLEISSGVPSGTMHAIGRHSLLKRNSLVIPPTEFMTLTVGDGNGNLRTSPRKSIDVLNIGRSC